MDLNINSRAASTGVTRHGASEDAAAPDELYVRVLKYVPTPLIGVYLLVVNAIESASNNVPEWLGWAVLVFFLAATVAYLVKRGVTRMSQVVVSVLAFLAIATTTPGPFQDLNGWDQLYSTLALAVMAVILIVFVPPLPPGDPVPATGS